MNNLQTLEHSFRFFEDDVLFPSLREGIWSQYEEVARENKDCGDIVHWEDDLVGNDTLIDDMTDQLVSNEAFNNHSHYLHLNNETEIEHFYETYLKVGTSIDHDILLLIDRMQLFICMNDKFRHVPLSNVW